MSVTAPEDTRERIRQVALELFCVQGYEKTSLREIADRLRVTKAALYYHFRSKDELVESVLDPFLDEFDDLLAAVQASPSGSVPERLLDDYLDLLLSHRQLIAWLSSDIATLAHPSVGPRVRELGDRLRGLLGGADITFVDRVRITAALGALNSGVASFPDAAAADLREPLVEAARSVLGKRPTVSGSPPATGG